MPSPVYLLPHPPTTLRSSSFFHSSNSNQLPATPPIMPLFKQLRRRSKANIHPSKSAPETKSNESQSNGEMTSGKSSSTLETASYSSLTPPSSIKPTLSSPNLPSLSESNGTSNNAVSPLSAPPQRPGLLTAPSQRNSAYVSVTHSGCGSLTDHLGYSLQFGSNMSVNGAVRSPTPSSPYAPRIISISDNSWVCTPLLFFSDSSLLDQ